VHDETEPIMKNDVEPSRSRSAPPSPSGPQRRAGRVRPWIALRGIVGQIRDSEDTAAGARFVYALQGRTTERVFQRFRADPLGARILAERRSIRETLTDRQRLRALPEGSLGRVYVDFMDAEGISLEGLDAAIAEPVREVFGVMDAERRLVHDRITDLHDLWHVATGYSRDMVGEFALLALGYEQLGNPAYRLSLMTIRPICALQAPGANALITDARRRGREASWLPVQDWEGLLDVPLDEARARLGLGPPPAYTRYFRVGRRLRPEGWAEVS
jgi:ubiquinone biosynthesis protein COQ4